MPRTFHLALALSFTLLLPSSAATVALGPSTEIPPGTVLLRSSLHANTLGPHHESLPLAIPSKQQMMYASANPVTTLHVTTHHDFA